MPPRAHSAEEKRDKVVADAVNDSSLRQRTVGYALKELAEHAPHAGFTEAEVKQFLEEKVYKGSGRLPNSFNSTLKNHLSKLETEKDMVVKVGDKYYMRKSDIMTPEVQRAALEYFARNGTGTALVVKVNPVTGRAVEIRRPWRLSITAHDQLVVMDASGCLSIQPPAEFFPAGRPVIDSSASFQYSAVPPTRSIDLPPVNTPLMAPIQSPAQISFVLPSILDQHWLSTHASPAAQNVDLPTVRNLIDEYWHPWHSIDSRTTSFYPESRIQAPQGYDFVPDFGQLRISSLMNYPPRVPFNSVPAPSAQNQNQPLPNINQWVVPPTGSPGTAESAIESPSRYLISDKDDSVNDLNP